ncbi:MAG: serine/threonine-protein kinase [Myxococcota bacterium]
MLSRLGAGAMGVVFAAYDPELDRKVALKLLKPHSDDQPSARARFQREAKALARLNHPNVVAVHDEGVYEGQMFLAMEFIVGQTLGEWMKPDSAERPRPWREVLRVFEAAGRGLAAAHAVELIHRDFKPDNVMIGDDGRVRVMDFGLAQVKSEQTIRMELGQLQTEGDNRTPVSLTKTGAILGTPAYMAPEQFAQKGVTARSDQFGYCVALYEALYGTRPFAGQTPAELVYAVTEGRIGDPVRSSGLPTVPQWLRKIVVRGLSTDPELRYADMPLLLKALEKGELRSRRNRGVYLVSGLAVLTASGVGYQRYAQARRVEACATTGDVIDDSWNEETRDALREGLLATEVPYAVAAADNVVTRVDERAESWRMYTTAACMNATVHERWTDATYAKAQWCLERQRLQLATLVEELTGADEQVVQRAVDSVAMQAPVAACMDEISLAGKLDPPAADIRPRVERVRKDVLKAESLHATGRYAAGLQVARAARLQAEELSWSPLTAHARATEARLLDATGAYAEGETAGIDAYVEAARAEAWDVAMVAAVQLVDNVGIEQARHLEGKTWARHAVVAIEHASDPQELMESSRLKNLGLVYRSMGKYDEAESLLEEALAIQQEALGSEHPHVAETLSDLGTAYILTGQHEEARATLERALAIREQALGSKHPGVADSLNKLGVIYRNLGEYGEAEAMHRRALVIQEQALGSKHPSVADSLNNLGNAHINRGDHAEAKAMHERALAIRKEALGPKHPKVADSLNNLGNAHINRGNHAEAKAMYERALAIQEEVLGPKHPSVADSLNNLGFVYYSLGAHEDAKRMYEHALSIREEALGPTHPSVADSLNNLGNIYTKQGEYEEAEAMYELALAIRQETLGPNHSKVADNLGNLGLFRIQIDKHERAEVLMRRTLGIQEETLGPEHPQLANNLINLGEALLMQEKHNKAVEHLERASTLLTTKDIEPVLLADARFTLARALWGASPSGGRDRPRARALAEQARQTLAADGPDSAERLAEVEQWLAEHPPPAR